MAILEVQNLSVDYLTDAPSASSGQRLSSSAGRGVTALHAVEEISFKLEKGRSLGMVGESGCGKTTACSRPRVGSSLDKSGTRTRNSSVSLSVRCEPFVGTRSPLFFRGR